MKAIWKGFIKNPNELLKPKYTQLGVLGGNYLKEELVPDQPFGVFLKSTYPLLFAKFGSIIHKTYRYGTYESKWGSSPFPYYHIEVNHGYKKIHLLQTQKTYHPFTDPHVLKIGLESLRSYLRVNSPFSKLLDLPFQGNGWRFIDVGEVPRTEPKVKRLSTEITKFIAIEFPLDVYLEKTNNPYIFNEIKQLYLDNLDFPFVQIFVTYWNNPNWAYDRRFTDKMPKKVPKI